MDPYTVDVLALVGLAVLFVGLLIWVVWVDRILRDPEHPDHETAREAVTYPFEDEWEWWRKP